MCYLYNYGVMYPASADIFNLNLVELIEFKAISPLNLLKLFWNGFVLEEKLRELKGAAGAAIKQYMIVIIIANCLIFVILVLIVAKLIPFLRKKAD
jgi:hypothetical protein